MKTSEREKQENRIYYSGFLSTWYVADSCFPCSIINKVGAPTFETFLWQISLREVVQIVIVPFYVIFIKCIPRYDPKFNTNITFIESTKLQFCRGQFSWNETFILQSWLPRVFDGLQQRSLLVMVYVLMWIGIKYVSKFLWYFFQLKWFPNKNKTRPWETSKTAIKHEFEISVKS